MGWSDAGASMSRRPVDERRRAADGASTTVIEVTGGPTDPVSTVSLCNANFSRVSLGNTGRRGASHA